MAAIEIAVTPAEGVWRVGRAPDPLALNPTLGREDLDDPRTGNRFDSPLGTYQVLYFASTLEACFGETLARFRPDVGLLAEIVEDWDELGFMAQGHVPRDWRQRRLSVLAALDADERFPSGVQFLDLDSGATRQALRAELASTLAYYGYDDLDAAVVHSHDRRITRWIGQWAYDAADDAGRPLYAGVRFLTTRSLMGVLGGVP